MRVRYMFLLAVLFCCMSCLKDDYTSKTPQAAITSFTIGYYNVRFYDVNIHGRDTLVYVREGGVMYPMTIDQVNNRIFNADSMAYGSDLRRVTSSVYGNGTIGYIYDDEPDVTYLWRSQDSIDFTRGIKFVAKSTDGSYTRVYDVTVNVRKVFPDSLLWGTPDATGVPLLSGITSAVRNDSIFFFGTDTTGVPCVTFRDITAGGWNGAGQISGFSAAGWNHRVTVCNGTFYTVCAGTLYGSADAVNWSSVKSGIRSLVVSADDNGVLWAVSQDSNIIRTEDMSAWDTVQCAPNGFPDSVATVFSYPLATNTSLTRSVLVGMGDDSLYASVWTMLTGDTAWTEVDAPAKTDLRLPYMNALSVFKYDGALFCLEGLNSFRQSNDNGITWYRCDSYAEDYSSWNRYMQLPRSLKGKECDYAAATDSRGFIWIMTGEGQVWRGAINRLAKN